MITGLTQQEMKELKMAVTMTASIIGDDVYESFEMMEDEEVTFEDCLAESIIDAQHIITYGQLSGEIVETLFDFNEYSVVINWIKEQL